MSATETCRAPSSARLKPPTNQARTARSTFFRCLQGLDPKHSPITTHRSKTHNSKLNGAQGRIRTSVTRCVADLQSAAINHSATCAHSASSSNAPHSSQPVKPVVDSTCESSGYTTLEGMTGGLQRQNGRAVQPNPSFFSCCGGLELAKGLEPPTL